MVIEGQGDRQVDNGGFSSCLKRVFEKTSVNRRNISVIT